MSDTGFTPATRYLFEGSDVAGTLDTTSITGSAIATVTVDGVSASEVTAGTDALGWVVAGFLDGVRDGYTRSVTVVLPRVHVDDDPEPFEGFAVVVTTRTSIGGQRLVKGPIESYVVRTVTGTASVVHS